jgi:hypothetical protein
VAKYRSLPFVIARRVNFVCATIFNKLGFYLMIAYSSKKIAFSCVLSFFLMMIFSQSGNAGEVMNQAEPESARLVEVRELVRSMNVGLTREDSRSSHEVLQCKAMLKDLLDKNLFVAIEPVKILYHHYPDYGDGPKTEQEVEKITPQDELIFGKVGKNLHTDKLVLSLKRCALAEANGEERRARALFNSFDVFSGAPPYRVYVLPDQLNPFPASKIVYWSEYLPDIASGRKGYSWVNANSCERTNNSFTPYLAESVNSKKSQQKAVLTSYPKALVVWSTTADRGVYADIYNLPYISLKKSRKICGWQ